jgi:hypothetical protein
MAERTIAEVRYDNLVAALDALRKRTRASYFNIVRMATDCKNIHFYYLFFVV